MRLETVRLTRRVWADVTRYPNSSMRERAERLEISAWSVVSYHLHKLRDAGYIDFVPERIGTITVLVPFVQVPELSIASESRVAYE